MSTTPLTPQGDDPNVGSMPLAEEPEVGSLTDGLEPDAEEPAGGSEPGEETPESDAAAEQPEGAEGAEDGREIPKWIRGLKETDPEQFKKAKADFFDLRDRRGLHPTVKAAREEHELLASAGGAQGITALREDAQFFKTAAQQFLKGDPAFVKDLFEEDPIAAAMHIPHMIEAYKTHDLEGYKSTIAQIWKNEFSQVHFGENLGVLRDMIASGNKEDALGLLSAFERWQKSILTVAEKAEDPRVKRLLTERQQRIDSEQQAERAEFHKNYRSETINAVVEAGSKVFDSFFKNRKIDPTDRIDLLRDAFRIANANVEKDEAFKKQRDGHLDAGNAAAAKRLTEARYARELPEAVKRVARRYGLVAGPAKPSTETPGKPPQSGQRPGPTGFIAVNQRPDPTEIDRDRTTNDMILSGRAVLKNGRKVDWSRLKRVAT